MLEIILYAVAPAPPLLPDSLRLLILCKVKTRLNFFFVSKRPYTLRLEHLVILV